MERILTLFIFIHRPQCSDTKPVKTWVKFPLERVSPTLQEDRTFLEGLQALLHLFLFDLVWGFG